VRLAVVEEPAFIVRVSLNVESGVRLGETVFTSPYSLKHSANPARNSIFVYWQS